MKGELPLCGISSYQKLEAEAAVLSTAQTEPEVVVVLHVVMDVVSFVFIDVIEVEKVFFDNEVVELALDVFELVGLLKADG